MHDDVTRILEAIDRGDAGASRRRLPLVYDELRALALYARTVTPPVLGCASDQSDKETT